MDFKELKEQFDIEFKKFDELLEKQNAEIKAFGESRKETAEKIEKQAMLLNEIKDELGKYQKELEALAKEQKEMSEKQIEFEKQSKRMVYGGSSGESIGEMFIKSAEFENMKKMNALTSAPVKIGSFFTKAGELTTTITGGLLVDRFRYPELVAPGARQMRIRDLLSVQATNAGAIDYIVESGFTNNAGAVAENSAKGQSALTFEFKTEAIKTIAHWIPVSRQVLSDTAQLQGYINTRLIYGVMVAEEVQILYGNGIAPNLTGIIPVAQDYSWSEGEVGDNKLDAIRRGITKAQLAEYEVNGIIINPADWEDIELLKSDDGKYLWVTASEGGVKRIFSVPVIVTNSINSGEALVGAFNLGAMLWDREEASVRISESHSDYFTKNMLAILGEERVALTVFRPEAFVSITFDGAPTGS